MLQKLTSRKFWLAVSQIVGGIVIMFGLTESTAATVSGAIMSLFATAIYIYTEGKIDAARIASTIQVVTDTVEEITEELK